MPFITHRWSSIDSNRFARYGEGKLDLQKTILPFLRKDSEASAGDLSTVASFEDHYLDSEEEASSGGDTSSTIDRNMSIISLPQPPVTPPAEEELVQEESNDDVAVAVNIVSAGKPKVVNILNSIPRPKRRTIRQSSNTSHDLRKSRCQNVSQRSLKSFATAVSPLTTAYPANEAVQVDTSYLDHLQFEDEKPFPEFTPPPCLDYDPYALEHPQVFVRNHTSTTWRGIAQSLRLAKRRGQNPEPKMRPRDEYVPALELPRIEDDPIVDGESSDSSVSPGGGGVPINSNESAPNFQDPFLGLEDPFSGARDSFLAQPQRRESIDTLAIARSPKTTIALSHTISDENAASLRAAVTALQAVVSTPTSSFTWPCPANGYGGFCKGAWKLREHIKGALRLRDRPSGCYTTTELWQCSKCLFEGPVHGTAKRRGFDIRVHTLHGIRYRWAFLAKSHLKKKSYTIGAHYGEGQYDSQFGCIFCCVEGKRMPIFEKVDSLMAHMVTHQVMPHSSEVFFSTKTRCIVGRTAGDSEDFDINIPPPAGRESPDSISSAGYHTAGERL
ncbi:MAG: hypothetical protein M1812_001496 [Candelaria pacifica]|nr:MAG: hypothetical protein M1812_001496 [Candelaria pacifica]